MCIRDRSKEGHCLHDLLGRVAENDYPMEVVAVVGNHDNLRYIAENHNVPFFHVPFPKDAVGKRKACLLYTSRCV